MGETSKIQWTNATINYWHGCKKVSPGCKYCYMYRDKEKYGQDGNVIIKTKISTLKSIYKKLTEPSLIFTCSWSDFFIKEADEWRQEAWEDIKSHPQHTYQILTKRPERILECLPKDWGEGYKNVWLGVSIESAEYEHRMDTLQNIPAQTRFISYEPLLGEVSFLNGLRGDVKEWLGDERFRTRIHWIIIGGESGNIHGKYKYRPCKLEWIEKILKEAKIYNNPVFVKQLGTHLAKELKLKNRHGGDIEEFPEHLRVRQYPR